MTQQTSSFVSSAIAPRGAQAKPLPLNTGSRQSLAERLWRALTTLRGRFVFFAFIIAVLATITAATILLSSLRANADLHTINKPSVDAAQAIVPYIENVDAQSANFLANTSSSDIHPCVITSIDGQTADQQLGNLSIHDCANRTIDADLQKINQQIYLAGHNVSFAGESTAIQQTETGLEEYVSDINLMRNEYSLATSTHSANDPHMRNAYRYSLAASTILHQQIASLNPGVAVIEPNQPSCTLGKTTLPAQTWPNGGIEQNVSCLSAISKANLDASYTDTVKFVGISLGLVFGLCIYSCIFLLWATWSMAATTHRLLNIGLVVALLVAIALTSVVLSDFDAIYGYKGNFSVIQNDYSTVYNAGLLQQESSDANTDQARWLLALQYKDTNANQWYTNWQSENTLVRSSLQTIGKNSNQSALYNNMQQAWNQNASQGQQVASMVRSNDGTINTGNIPTAEASFTNTVNTSFQTFLQATNHYSSTYSGQYTTLFNHTNALLNSLMTWCAAAFLLLGFVAAWGITRRLKDF
jgi:hypothetical protein